jgi:restriction endonuclease Mrr
MFQDRKPEIHYPLGSELTSDEKRDPAGGELGILEKRKTQQDLSIKGFHSNPEIQKFAGALQGQRARKGVFITTSNFTKDALNYVENIDTKIILIDGQRLAEIMIAYNVGANTTAIYEVKKIDSDYFIEE